MKTCAHCRALEGASGSFSSYAISKMLSELAWLLFKELRAAVLMCGLLCFEVSHYIIRNGMSACRVVAHLTPLVLFSESGSRVQPIEDPCRELRALEVGDLARIGIRLSQ